MTTVAGATALSSSGVVLPLPHATAMMSSLPILQKNYKFSKVFYWGKLQGVKGEYLIAMGIEESYTQKKFFFWCAPGTPTPRARSGCGQLSAASARARGTKGGWEVGGSRERRWSMA